MVTLCIILTLCYSRFRGFMGEFWIRRELNKLPKERYLILNDIMIENKTGTHQIDHIVISNYAIFVIETKNYYGLITGREYDDVWCQHLGKNKYYFLNPIHQNYGHIKCLMDLLKKDMNDFVSIICFSNQSKLRLKCKNFITQVDLLKKDILKFDNKINNDNLESLFKIIEDANIKTRKKRRQHVNVIRQKQELSTIKEDVIKCPKCGGKLIEKRGKFGKFIGCSNYPKCFYIKK